MYVVSGDFDFVILLNELENEVFEVEVVLLVVLWFGDDLCVGYCSIWLMVELDGVDLMLMFWIVGGL